MKSHKDNAEFLHLFSLEETGGLKFLTHDAYTGDLIEYIYKCQQLILSKRAELDIHPSIYELVRGFVFGPEWIDYKGDKHYFFISSEDSVSYYEGSGRHPLNNKDFEKHFEDFRNSIRFRSGRLDSFLREEMKMEFPELDITVAGNLKGADMYTDVGSIRRAIRLILKSMQEYGQHPKVVVSYLEDDTPDDYIKSTITLTQFGSFPAHALSRDMSRLHEGNGGTLGTIRQLLDGLGEWSICSKWLDRESSDRWRILRSETEAELSSVAPAEGFSHVISIYHKP